jgi:hypothetical protein
VNSKNLKNFLWDRLVYSNKAASINPIPPAIAEVKRPIIIVLKKITPIRESKEKIK